MSPEQATQVLKDAKGAMWFWGRRDRRAGYEQDEELFQTLYRLAEQGEIGKHASSLGEWDERIHFTIRREALR